jgi:cobyrinic acid a,c-diamide synthase
MCGRLQALGYVEVETKASTILGAAGTRFRGHQFRYSELSPAPALEEVDHVYSLSGRGGHGVAREGYRVGNVLASYVHAHWASNPGVATGFVESCVRRELSA